MSRIKAVLVGLNFGRWVIEHEILTQNGADYIELMGVFDLDQAKTADAAKTYDISAFSSFQEILEDQRVEAVILITGPQNRSDLVMKILQAGKHVMTTKPFELSSEKAAAALSLAAKRGLVLHMNSPAPILSEDLKQIKIWAEAYDLGRPIAFRASTHCSYREQSDGSWYDDPMLCPVAPIFRLGIYLLNDVSCFFPNVQDITVQSSSIFTGRPTPDNAQLGIIYENGAIGNVFSSFCIQDQQFYRCSLEINFEKGSCYRNVGPVAAENQEKILMELATVVDGKPVIKQKTFLKSGAGYRWDFFHKAIRQPGATEDITFENILAGVRIVELMQQKQFIRGEKYK